MRQPTAPCAAALPVPLSLTAVLAFGCYAAGAAMGLLAGATTSVGSVATNEDLPSAPWLFLHNVGVLAWLALGLWTAGMVSGATMMVNGAMLGWLAGHLLADGSASVLYTAVLPHLVPELAAYVLSAASSAAAGIALATRLRHRGPDAHHPNRSWVTSWLRTQAIAIGLLAVAALLESTVSYV
ncbi:MAG TPA: stage II sporulation protein M [Actinomycetales bacterium]|nr:stage II sporulation protein M [Actinomycetales bacterium]